MYMLEKTAGTPLAVGFYILVVIIGSNFLVNLFLAVLFDAFSAQQEKQLEAEEALAAREAEIESENMSHLSGSSGGSLNSRRSLRRSSTSGIAVSGSKARLYREGERIVYGLIVLNTVTMCASYYGEPEAYHQLEKLLNVVFTAAFLLEMICKLCAFGCSGYFGSGWNRFDFFVTWCSVIDLGMEQLGRDTDFLRALRVARVMRLLRLSRKMRRFEDTATKVASLVTNLSCILILIMVVFAMLGMELFGGRMGAPPPRAHFDDFSSALITVFTITSGEDWNAVFASSLENGAVWSLAASYFIPLFLIDNYVLVNLFVAIICWGWESAGTQDEVVGFTATVGGSLESFTHDAEGAYKSVVARVAGVRESSVKLIATKASKEHYRMEVAIQPPPPITCDDVLSTLINPDVVKELREKAMKCGIKVEGMGDVEIKLKDEDEVETDLAMNARRLERAHTEKEDHARALRAEHALLKQTIMQLGKAKRLGLTEADSASLNEQLEQPLSDFLAASQVTMNQSLLVVAENVAGLTLGFATLVSGLRQLLMQLGMPELAAGSDAAAWPSEATLLLLEYIDSEHAMNSEWPQEHLRHSVRREEAMEKAAAEHEKMLAANPPQARPTKGGKKDDKRRGSVSAPPSRPRIPPLEPLVKLVGGRRLLEELELLLKEYSMCLLAEPFASNPNLMADLADLRGSARHYRLSKGPRGTQGGCLVCLGDCWGAFCSGAMPVKSEDDVLGALALPLGKVSDVKWLRMCREVVASPWFEGLIQFCIVCSSAALMFDMPNIPPDGELKHILHNLDVTFTTIFVAEMSLKLYAFGAFVFPDGYFRSAWNQLDATIVTTSVLSLALKDVEGLSALRAMRALRALRPLRMIQRNPGLKKVVNSLFRSIPQVGDVAWVCLLVLIVYGLFGMQFLSGHMASCNDESIQLMEDCTGTFTLDGVKLERWWGNDDIGNFDNIMYAMLTLFEMATLEMWPDMLWRAMDTDPSGPGRGLHLNANKAMMAPFIISWIVVSAFFLLNLFVGVVLENFNAIRKKEDGSGFMDEDQREWARAMHNILLSKTTSKPESPSGKHFFAKLRRKCFNIVAGDPKKTVTFEKSVAMLVLLNVLSMAVTWYNQPEWVDVFQEVVDDFFTTAFLIEMVLKVMGLGPSQYANDPWNLLDGFLVSASIAEKLLMWIVHSGLPVSPTFLRMLRFFRVARLLKLVRVNPGIKRLLSTVVVSAPSLLNVGLLLIIIMYIYAILGVEFFHKIAHSNFINADANFETFQRSMLTLARCITGES